MSRNAKILLILLVVLILLGGLLWFLSQHQSVQPVISNSPLPINQIDTNAENETTSILVDSDGSADTVSICSFNIQFLGNSKKRDNKALAWVVKDFDIVVVQELVAPPAHGIYPDGTTYEADPEAVQFIQAMEELGYRWVYSEEDTGTGDKIHLASSATEWWIAFYKPEAVTLDSLVPHGFLASDRSNHPDYERVPYSFGFTTTHTKADFGLISVHLQPGEKAEEVARRKHELASIASWVAANSEVEKDFIVLGDMNIYTQQELMQATPKGYKSLNYNCVRTNTLINSDKDAGARPYDHVMYNLAYTQHEIDTNYGFQVLDLVQLLKSTWTLPEPYPGEPYNHNAFRSYYSDHHPVAFQLIFTGDDDGLNR